MLGLTWREVLDSNEHVLLAIRHGETAHNAKNLCLTSTDVELSERGREAALSISTSLGGGVIDRAFTSPLIRARETANLAMRGFDGTIDVDERLREPSAGPFEGENFKDLWGEDHPLSAQFHAYMSETNPVAPEGAESLEETKTKVGDFLAMLEATPGRYVAFSHGGLLRVMACLFAGTEPSYAHRLKLDNCHALALKWWPKPPHQVLSINLPPWCSTRGGYRDSSDKAGTTEIQALGPNAAAAYGRQLDQG